MWLWHVKTAEVLSLLEIQLFPVYEGCWGTSIRRIRPDINKCFQAVPCDGRAAMEDMEAWTSVFSFPSCFLTPLIIAISKHQLGLSVAHATWKSMICAHWQSWYFFCVQDYHHWWAATPSVRSEFGEFNPTAMPQTSHPHEPQLASCSRDRAFPHRLRF